VNNSAARIVLQMVLLLRNPYLFYGIKYGFVAMLFTTPYIASSILFSFTYIFIMRREEQLRLNLFTLRMKARNK
jgi:hypothetical protein